MNLDIPWPKPIDGCGWFKGDGIVLDRNSGRTGTVKHTCGHLSGLFDWGVLNTKPGVSYTPQPIREWDFYRQLRSGYWTELTQKQGRRIYLPSVDPPAVRQAREQPDRKETDTAGGETGAGGRVNKQTWDLFYTHLLFWLLFIWSWQDRADLDCWKGGKLTL